MQVSCHAQGGAGENLFSTFSILETRLSGAPAAAGTHSDGQSPSLAVVGPSPGLLIGQRECFRQRADFELAKFRRNFGEILPKIWQRQKFAELLPKFPRKFAKILAQSFCRSFAENLAKSLPNFCRSLGESWKWNLLKWNLLKSANMENAQTCSNRICKNQLKQSA